MVSMRRPAAQRGCAGVDQGEAAFRGISSSMALPRDVFAPSLSRQ